MACKPDQSRKSRNYLTKGARNLQPGTPGDGTRRQGFVASQGVFSASERWEMRHLRFILLPSLLLVLCSASVACRRRDSPASSRGKVILLDVKDRLPAFDVYFTWEGYNPRHQLSSNVRYIWNGDNVGIGDDGCKAVLARLQRLPSGAKVLVYPSYETEWYREVGEPAYPWGNWYCEIVDTAIAQGVTLIISPRDHLGVLHPHCIGSTQPAPQTGR